MSVALENTIYISDKAKAKVQQLMADAGVANDPSYFLRVGVVGGGCSGLTYTLNFDGDQRPGDTIIESENIKLFVDGKSLFYLMGTQLDYSDGLNGRGFVFNNPNAAKTCGCGESFGV